MVDTGALLTDIGATTATLALPPLLWLFLYLIAWDDPEAARASGFGRRTFWLLFPAGILAEVLGTLPIFAWDGDVLGINLAGGAIPIVLSALFLYRGFGASGPRLGRFLGALAIETTALFALVVLAPSGTMSLLAALAIAAAVPAVAALSMREIDPTNAAYFSTAIVLTSSALYLTFVATEPIPGFGIASSFPFYLIAPGAVGLLAAPLLHLSGRTDRGESLALAYATATLGTLVGADVLHQPPLYGVGPPAFFSIGGAGLLDLLYLSGLLAAAVAYVALRAWGEDSPPTSTPSDARTAHGWLGRGLSLGYAGRSVESTAASARAADLALGESRDLAGIGPAPTDQPWSGFGTPPWVDADHRNLRALAASGTSGPRDAGRAWTTSRWLVRISQELGGRRRARAGARGAAFGIDLVLTLPFFVTALFLVALGTGTNYLALVGSVAFNAVGVGYAAFAFVYLVLAEALTGTTVGKSIMGLSVTDRSLRRPGPVACLLRNIPKLVPFSVVGIGGSVVLALLLGASSLSPTGALSPLGSLYLGFVLALILVLLALVVVAALFIAWLGIHFSRERQRLGDYLAGTWVVYRARPPA